MMGLVLFVLSLVLVLELPNHVHCVKPASVNVGAILTYDSVIGRVAKAAIEAAVADINRDPSILGETRLNVFMENSNCSGFIGLVGAFRLLGKDVLAIIGPQSSTIAHMLSFIANGLQLPLVSFGATDPTLSSLQFPFFVRTTQTDFYQMSAMAELIEYYGWRQIIAIFVDDEYGRNGISVLGDELAKRKSSIYYKIALPLRASPSRIADLLDKSKFMGRRVYVVHVSPDSGIDVFTIAYKLQMMTDGFVWLTTDWLCTALDSSASTKIKSFEYLQGVVSFCPYIPQSHQNSTFMYKWSSKLNKYGLYAYDTVWAVAHAIDEYLNGSGNITFSHSNTMRDMRGKIQLDRLKIFDGGKMLLNKLLQVNFTGLTGTVRFNLERNRITTAYEIINIDREEIHTVGYWTHHLGFTNVPPKMSFESGHRNLIVDRNLGNVTWPGGKKEIPRGWVLSGNDKVLRVGVPNRASYIAFSTESKSTHKIEGYCIDVFKAALKYIPYAVPYRFVPVGDGLSNPNYDELVNMVAENIIDAAVGDIAIVTNRTKAVDFTQPYAATGLVVVAPIRISKSSTWVFLKPFTVQMWCVTLAFFILIGVVIWVLEHRVNSDFRGPPRQQLITMFL